MPSTLSKRHRNFPFAMRSTSSRAHLSSQTTWKTWLDCVSFRIQMNDQTFWSWWQSLTITTNFLRSTFQKLLSSSNRNINSKLRQKPSRKACSFQALEATSLPTSSSNFSKIWRTTSPRRSSTFPSYSLNRKQCNSRSSNSPQTYSAWAQIWAPRSKATY